MATLLVTDSTDFRGRAFSNIDTIILAEQGTVATFGSDQFSTLEIRPNVAMMSANIGTGQQVRVFMSAAGTFSAAGWDVSDWSALPFVFRGTSGVDTITGSDKADIITGGRGADILSGGGGNDVFQLASEDAVTGESISGGSGTDAIEVTGGISQGTVLANMTLSSIEVLRFTDPAFMQVHLKQEQVSTTAIRTVIGNSARNDISVSGASVDLTGVQFQSWNAAVDTIRIFGTSADNILTGSDQGDTLMGNGGADDVFGGDGNDFIHYNVVSDLVSGESADGGAGFDTVLLGAGNWALDRVSLSSMEGLKFIHGDSQATLTGAQIGSGVGSDRIRHVDGAAGANTITVKGSDVDLSGLTFQDWDNTEDLIDIIGTAGTDVIVGSSQDDRIRGGALADQLDGGGGVNTLSYSSSSLSVSVNLASGSGSTGDAAGDRFVNFSNLEGSRFGDRLTGDAQDNVIEGRAGADVLDGGGGVNTLTYASSSVGVNVNLALGSGAFGDAGGDRFVNFSNIQGSGFNDSLTGDALDNVITGGAGADFLEGGGGLDTLSYQGSVSQVLINLGNGDARGGDAQGDVIVDFRHLLGSDHADALFGNGLENTINGGRGADSLFGGLNNDTFVFRRGEADGDTLLDFEGNGAAVGDQIRFEGYGPGASLVQVDATHWEIRSTGPVETLTVSNGASIHVSDVLFV